MTHENYIGIRKALAQMIKGSQWEGHVYLVGGCVRDEIMHREIHDVDIAMDVVNGGIRFARWLEKRHLTARGGRSVLTFPHFGTAKVRLRMFPTETIDCVQTRKDKYEFEEHPHPEKNFGTIAEDALRRDLTINSLYINVSTNELLDPTEMGMHDIENHIIRTPNDPDVTFTDNAMHIPRCIRFAVRYGWELDPSLLDSMRRNVAIIADTSLTRKQKEVTSILALEHPEQALQLLESLGALPYLQPIIESIQRKQQKQAVKEEQPAEPQPHHRRRRRRRWRSRGKGGTNQGTKPASQE